MLLSDADMRTSVPEHLWERKGSAKKAGPDTQTGKASSTDDTSDEAVTDLEDPPNDADNAEEADAPAPKQVVKKVPFVFLTQSIQGLSLLRASSSNKPCMHVALQLVLAFITVNLINIFESTFQCASPPGAGRVLWRQDALLVQPCAAAGL